MTHKRYELGLASQALVLDKLSLGNLNAGLFPQKILRLSDVRF